MSVTRRRLLGTALGVAAISTPSPMLAWVHGSAAGGAGGGTAPTFDATQTVRGSARSFVDLSALLAAVPDGNFVAVTPHSVSGLPILTLDVWQNPSLSVGASYSHAKRELAKNLTVTLSGVPDTAGVAWISCVYNSGPGETGSPVTWTLGLNVVNAITTWAMGAKTWARCGGPLISMFGDGSATAISSQVDKNSVARTAFEVFKGRLVWKSTDGAANTYGRTRSVDYAASLTQSPYTVTLNNGAVITVTAVDGQWDIAPADPSVVSGNGSDADQLTNTMWGKTFARGDVIMFEDGDQSVSSPRGSHTFVSHTTQLTGATTGNMPTAPTGWNIMDLEQPGWLTLKSRTPWGAKMGSYTFGSGAPDLAGSTSSLDVGSYYIRFTNLELADEIRLQAGESTVRRYGWVQIDSCYADRSASVNRQGNSTAGLFYSGDSTSPGGRHHIYIHDNWVKWPTFGVDIQAEDSEVIGNRIDYASEDAIRHGLWDTDTATTKSKVWWNFMTGKWWGMSSHPDYIQVFGRATYAPRMDTLYPKDTSVDGSGNQIPANFTSTVPWGSMVGNIGIPDSVNNCQTGDFLNSWWTTANNGVPPDPLYTSGVDHQVDDGEGFLAGDFDNGRFYTWLLAGEIRVSSMSNGYYIRNQGPNSRMRYTTMIQDYWPAQIPGRVADRFGGAPAVKINGATLPDTGKISDSFIVGGYTTQTGQGPSYLPALTNCNSSTYFSASAAVAVMPGAITNWSNVSRMQEVLDAIVTIGVEAGRGAVADKTKVDHRNRTFDASLFA